MQSQFRRLLAPFGRGTKIGFVRPKSRGSSLGVGGEIGFVWPKSRDSPCGIGTENWVRLAKIARFIGRPRGAEIGFVWPKSRGSRCLLIFGLLKSEGRRDSPTFIRSAAAGSRFHDSGNRLRNSGFSIREAGIPRGTGKKKGVGNRWAPRLPAPFLPLERISGGSCSKDDWTNPAFRTLTCGRPHEQSIPDASGNRLHHLLRHEQR